MNKESFRSPQPFKTPAPADKTFAAHFKGRVRSTVHRVRNVLKARRNGVTHAFSFTQEGRALRVFAQSTTPEGITIARTLRVGPRGGLYQVSNGRRRYLKAAQIGRGSV